jgi:hypothetical protein
MQKLNWIVGLTELWSRVLLQKLVVMQVHSKLPALYRTWKFITVYTASSHLSLSWAKWIQSAPYHHRIIFMLSFYLHLMLAGGILVVRLSSHVPWCVCPSCICRVYKWWFLWCGITFSSLIPVFLSASCSGASADCAHSVMLQTKVHSVTHELHLLQSALCNVPGGLSDWLCNAVLPLFLCFHGYTRAWLVCDGTARWLHLVCSKCKINGADSLWVKSHLL